MSTLALYSLTVLIWGSSWLAIHYQIGVVAPAVSIIYRFFLASLLLIIWCLIRGISLRVAPRHQVFLALMGFCLFCLNYILFYHAAFDLATGLPGGDFFDDYRNEYSEWRPFLKRPIRRQTLLGIAFGLSGMALVFWPEIAHLGHDALAAIGISVLATYSASLGNIISVRNQLNGIAVAPANAIGMAYGALFLLIFSVGSGTPFEIDLSATYLGSLVFLALFASAIAFGTYLTLVGRIPV